MAADPVLSIVDAQAGGDISRVIVEGAPPLRGRTVARQCADFARHFDHLRLKLIQPPHGQLHMCPVLLLPSRNRQADFGVIIMESMGYPPISGSNLFCATAVALEHGLAPMREPQTHLRVETPAGIVAVTATCRAGRCREVAFDNTPARLKGSFEAALEGIDFLPVTLVEAGVEYAVVDSRALDLSLRDDSVEALAGIGAEITSATNTDFALFHGAVSFRRGDPECALAVFQRPGVICRSPTGTGTSAFLALAWSRGWIAPGTELKATSPAGNSFFGRILGVHEAPTGPLIHTRVAGQVRIIRHLTID